VAPVSGAEPAPKRLRDDRAALEAIFAPKSVAVIGATERPGSVGRTLIRNLVANPFGGVVFPVTPTRSSVLGIKAYPSVAAVPERVDLAIVVTPAPSVPALVAECVQAGVKGAIVISAGFKETGADGVELERRVLEEARRGRLRLIGPNCLGVMSPHGGLNATFANAMAIPGRVAFLSQSGALCTAVLDWSLREHVGFSTFVSLGSMLDVGWGDLIAYFGEDPRTQSIVIYMETIGDARAFLSAAREVSRRKPIIVIKPGRTEGAARAAASHTGSLAGSDEVVDAAFLRGGVVRVTHIDELFHLAESLGKQPRPLGPRLTIVTNAGGPAVIATDALLLNGGQLAPLADETRAALDRVLPAHWSHGNPVDVLGDADAARYAAALDIVTKDSTTDGILVVLTPQAMTDPTQTAERLKPYASVAGKPVLASWMGGVDIAAGEAILARSNIPTFAHPDTAARVFSHMWRYTENLRALYETPALAAAGSEDHRQQTQVPPILERARRAGRVILTEDEAKRVLAAYGIPVVETRVAATVDDAVRAATELGFPVVLKLHSETVTHKTDVGGVQLGLGDADAVRRAWAAIERGVTAAKGEGHFQGVTVQPMVQRTGYELIVGSTIDAEFGPVLLFGTGGQLVEVYRDRALGLPPLTTTLARRMMERTRIFTALGGVRGRAPVDLTQLEQLLVRVSHLVIEQPWIKELDINPLLASPEALVVLDARVILHPADTRPEDLPRPAIRPYPVQYVGAWQSKDGTPFMIRPIRPDDEPLMVTFHGTLSERSVYFRYLSPLALSQRVAHERLSSICFVDYDREMVLVAERRGAAGKREIVAVGRLSRLHWREEAEFALLVSDPLQKQGLGSELLRRLVAIGAREKLRRIVGYISAENADMLRVARATGFRTRRSAEDHTLIDAWLDLPAAR
jgi:acetyltransferase